MKKIFYFLMISFPVYAQFNAPDFEGFWRGYWFNNTFQSTDSAFVTIDVTESGSTIQITLDLEGNVFGGTNPEAIVMNGTYDNNGFTVSGNSATYGNVFFSGSNGNMTGLMPDVPSAFVDSTTLSGTYNPDSMNLAYLVYFGGSPFADGVINVYKDQTTDVSENIITPKYYLSQNYPNPFNPATNIEFQVAGNGFVKVKIYDLLGNDVATIVNEELPPGSYTRHWNAEGLSSGVYIYKIEAGEYVNTRKMILMK